jgi:predicted DNA-binding protein (MmcQ/YjbR family)
MNIEEFYTFCLSKKGVVESFPFDHKTLVFKVGGKMFSLVDIESFNSVNLKSEPEKAIDYRERFSAVKPGYHMNKKHRNTVYFNNDVDDVLLKRMIDESYDLIFKTLPKKLQDEIAMG